MSSVIPVAGYQAVPATQFEYAINKLYSHSQTAQNQTGVPDPLLNRLNTQKDVFDSQIAQGKANGNVIYLSPAIAQATRSVIESAPPSAWHYVAVIAGIALACFATLTALAFSGIFFWTLPVSIPVSLVCVGVALMVLSATVMGIAIYKDIKS